MKLADDEYEYEVHEYLEIIPAPAGLMGIGLSGYTDEDGKHVDETCEYDVIAIGRVQTRTEIYSKNSVPKRLGWKQEPRVTFLVMTHDQGVLPGDSVGGLARYEFRDGRKFGERSHMHSRHEDPRIKDTSIVNYVDNVIPHPDPTPFGSPGDES